MQHNTSITEINEVMEAAWAAFLEYRQWSLARRAGFMRAVAAALEATGDELIRIAMAETHLPEARLRNERGRTIAQLQQYATACEAGEWLEARIDTAIADRNPPRPDLRKMLVPLGPVVVFGASNFPFAYSTAGGDTACAFAAGCPVIVKAHPAHRQTSAAVARAIEKAALEMQLPQGIFSHVEGDSFEVGEALVQHPRTAAVGFTGSYQGGKALFDCAARRKVPIPVFAEMGSVNPVFLLPEKMKTAAEPIAEMYAGSITLGVGQFCTNPGLLIGIEGAALDRFTASLGQAIRSMVPAKMLHAGIASAYATKKNAVRQVAGLEMVAEAELAGDDLDGRPAIASVSGKEFLENPLLHQEIFGPYSLVVRCSTEREMLEIANTLEGQLTATLMATEADMRSHADLVEAVKNICGRFILNGVPTGVEVCLSMQHGGPFPATTDSRFTSVGADGIKRFARPLAFQNWPDALLPAELQQDNPLGIWRTVNNQLTRE